MKKPFQLRYSTVGRYHAETLIPEADVLRRVLTSIRTLKAMPDRERRFLVSGTKSAWVPILVEWADLVAQAENPPDDCGPREKTTPTRAEVGDALAAGEWFAKLALLPENYQGFQRRLAIYRESKSHSPQVDDQKILAWVAGGWSLRLIGERIKLNEDQAERRFNEISRNLFRIANGTARLIDPEAEERGAIAARKRCEELCRSGR